MYNPDGTPQAATQQAQPVPPLYNQPLPPPQQPAPYVPPVAPERKPISQQTLITWGIVGVIVLAALIVLAITGEIGSFFSVGVVFIPLAALAALAYAGAKSMAAQVFAYIVLAIVMFGLFFNSLTYVVFGYVSDWDRFNQILSTPGSLSRESLDGLFSPNAGGGILLGVGLLFLASLISAAMLFRPVRAMVGRVVPIDPDNFVHKMALPVLTMVLLSSFIPLLILGGRPPLLTLVNGTSGSATSNALTTGPEDLIYQFVWTIPAALVMAGWPIARKFRAALERLGFVKPTRNQVVFGVAAGVVLAFVASYGIDPGINWVWQTLGWPTTDAAAFEKLLSNVITPVGAILIGVTAGVGEEMAVRGLLQPRIGLIASNLVFTGLHAFQYGLDGLLSVFLIGLILGIIRARTNTTTSAVVHGIYDFTLVLWSVIAGG